MNYQRLYVGIAIGTATAGLAFLLFHPRGKKLRGKVTDIALDAADKLIDVLRANLPTEQEVNEAESEAIPVT